MTVHFVIDRLSALGGLFDDAILDVGQVHHLRDAIPLLDEDTADQLANFVGW